MCHFEMVKEKLLRKEAFYSSSKGNKNEWQKNINVFLTFSTRFICVVYDRNAFSFLLNLLLCKNCHNSWILSHKSKSKLISESSCLALTFDFINFSTYLCLKHHAVTKIKGKLHQKGITVFKQKKFGGNCSPCFKSKFLHIF